MSEILKRPKPIPRKTRKALLKAVMLKTLTQKEHKRLNKLFTFWNKQELSNYNKLNNNSDGT